MSILCLAASIVFDICGTVSLKLSEGFSRIGPAATVAVCYTGSFALLSLALIVLGVAGLHLSDRTA